MKPLFLIPARGGSKGVPGKNIRLLAGVPLICHSIRHALATAPSADDVVVSTDSAEIAKIAEKAGAKVPFLRPAELATDTAGSIGVMLHAADTLNQAGHDYDCIVLLQPTSPLRIPAEITRALQIFEEKRPDMVVSVRNSSANPYYNLFETNGEGFLEISKGPGNITRRQDAPPVWEIDGAIYVISLDALRSVNSLASLKRIIPLPSEAPGIDIDTEADFAAAEALLAHK